MTGASPSSGTGEIERRPCIRKRTTRPSDDGVTERPVTALQNVRHDVRDERFRTAVLIGLASIPVTIGSNLLLAPGPLSGNGTVSATALFVACLLTGGWYQPRPARSARAGAVTALVGSLPLLLWLPVATVREWMRDPTVVDAVGDSLPMAAIVLAIGGATLVFLGLSVLLVGRAGATVGAWLTDRLPV